MRYQPEPTSGQLFTFLANGNNDLISLFQIRNIVGDIKANMSKFVNFLKTHKTMLKQIIEFSTRKRE